ncbi:hypothetical protein L7F22_029461 [Adiantum nelumboides]|nr:hypothetical protein [Adiantum nelumboides]
MTSLTATQKKPKPSVGLVPDLVGDQQNMDATECAEHGGEVRNQEVLIFFDRGARANFMSPELASKLGVRAEEMGMTGEAGLACRGHLEAVIPVLGKLRQHIQSYVDAEEFHIRLLQDCDVLLGIPWCYMLHVVVDTFHKKITLVHRGKTHVLDVKLKGKSIPALFASVHSSVIKNHLSVYLVFAKEVHEVESNLSKLDKDRATFLNGFSDYFLDSLPDELPPERPEDHRIDVVPCSSPPIRPPYRVKNSSLKDIWASKLSHNYYGCSDPNPLFLGQVKYQSNGYLLVEASGGLNQQRTGIIDAVVVAWILNATLVIPRLDHTSFWKDTSNFSDIFEEDQFISTVGQFVAIVRRLPRSMQIHDEDKALSVPVPRKCTPDYYKKNVLPVLQKNKVILLRKFDYRLSNRLDKDLQKLRCKVNYHALQFTRGIKTMGAKLVERLRKRNGRYIALHLRFEPDMLAFTGCYYGGGEKEIKELMLLRKRWKNIPHRNPEKAWRNGRCPLTPEEVGLMLRALGYGSDTYLYVASGEIYGGESTLAPLRKLFPNFFTKDMLATHNDLNPFSAYSSRMAAIDYIVCDESDVFVTNNNGNMARMLAGRRRYFGHKRTIRPNAKKLKSIFLARHNMTWEAFRVKVKKYQKGFLGEPMDMRPGRGQFFENPSACTWKRPVF